MEQGNHLKIFMTKRERAFFGQVNDSYKCFASSLLTVLNVKGSAFNRQQKHVGELMTVKSFKLERSGSVCLLQMSVNAQKVCENFTTGNSKYCVMMLETL